MNKPNLKFPSEFQKISTISEIIPRRVRKWVESLPLNQQRYVLSLCHVIGAAPKDRQIEFLNNYATDGLVSKMLQDKMHRQIVKSHLKKFHIDTELNYFGLKTYVEQFYIHSAQDLRLDSDAYLELLLRLFYYYTEERNNLFHYILGFEVIKMIFQMSWLQHERFYKLQKNQEIFIKSYIKPIQYTHRINQIIVPKNEKVFFAKRNYFIKQPKIKEKKLIELAMATFNTDAVTHLGFSIIRHLNFLVFDYEYIFNTEPEGIFIL